MQTSRKVGFIGLGGMGLPMAERVLKAGFELFTTPHHRREPADRLASLGAHLVESNASVARSADILITIVPADPELKEVVLGSGGLVDGLSPGKILIDMTTALPATILELNQVLAPFGVGVLDAPVSGGTTGAVNGTLTIMAGGDATLLQECTPLLQSMGTNIMHVGAIGQGKVVKMINQLMAATHLVALGEAFALGVRCGADPATLYEVIKNSSGHSRMLDARFPMLRAGTFEPGFKLDLMKKDVNLALDSARAQSVPVLIGSAVGQILAAASTAGHGAADFAIAAKFLADLAGAQLAAPAGAKA